MELKVGDWVVVTIKRDDYLGLEGQIVNPYFSNPYFNHRSVPFGHIIQYWPVELDVAEDQLPKRLAQMPRWMPRPSQDSWVYFFTRSQIELVGSWNHHAEKVLGEDYFA